MNSFRLDEKTFREESKKNLSSRKKALDNGSKQEYNNSVTGNDNDEKNGRKEKCCT